jgi:acyl-CoA synthetase (AMP-forming)/AMP-acid ligase II
VTATVVARVRQRAVHFGGRVAIRDGERSLTFDELFDRVDRLSRGLAELGLVKGDALLAYLPNVHQAAECELAALQSGLPWITLTARLTWPEVRGVVASCKPSLLVTDGRGLERIIDGLVAFPLDGLPRILLVQAPGEAPLTSRPLACMDYESFLAAHEPVPVDVVIGPEDVARLRYTSGTTGSAKAAVLPHRVYHASLDNLLDVLAPASEHDRALHAAPLTHGSGALLYPILHSGGENVLLQEFDASGLLERIERHAITTLFTVPTMLTRMVNASDRDTRDLGSLRALIYGGAPMPEAQLRAAVAHLGPSLVHIYGMTEAPWPITSLRQADHRMDNPRLTSIGKPSPSCEVRVTGVAGEALAAREVGEIRIRGTNVMSRYYEDETRTREVLTDGWLRSGDMGYLDEGGYVFIVGRAKDVIISGGFNVYAAEVEAALSTHEDVLESAVVGIPDAEWGELVTAFVVPRPGATLVPAQLDACARRLLSGYKCPRRIEIVRDLPKNASGKIQKTELVRAGGATTLLR